MIGTMPSLTELDKDEPKMTTDFRSVYAALLGAWLGLRADDMGQGINPLALFAS
jgi:uncharacterized protein (DUF1501 family)